MSSNQPLNSMSASRFVRRWLAASPERASELEKLAGLSLATVDFDQLLQQQRMKVPSLPAAMRRLRNLLMAALIQRDLCGAGNLDEVLTVISGFAEFVVRTHQDALHAELCALHGMPVGAESGEPQELIVIGMGKLGGRELNVSSDIDLIYVYDQEGETAGLENGRGRLSNHEYFAKAVRQTVAWSGSPTDVPVTGLTADNAYSIRWAGFIRPCRAGDTYTFYTLPK